MTTFSDLCPLRIAFVLPQCPWFWKSNMHAVMHLKWSREMMTSVAEEADSFLLALRNQFFCQVACHIVACRNAGCMEFSSNCKLLHPESHRNQEQSWTVYYDSINHILQCTCSVFGEILPVDTSRWSRFLGASFACQQTGFQTLLCLSLRFCFPKPLFVPLVHFDIEIIESLTETLLWLWLIGGACWRIQQRCSDCQDAIAAC